MPRAAALSQTCHSSSVLGSEANARYHTHCAINAASSFTSRSCSLLILFQLPKRLAAEDIPRPGKPWQQWQWQHVLDVSSLSCSTAWSNGNQAAWAEAVWLFEVGNAGHLGLARRLSGFQDSKLFVLIKFCMWKKKKQLPEIISDSELQSLKASFPNNEKIYANIKEIRWWNCLGLRYFYPLLSLPSADRYVFLNTESLRQFVCLESLSPFQRALLSLSPLSVYDILKMFFASWCRLYSLLLREIFPQLPLSLLCL